MDPADRAQFARSRPRGPVRCEPAPGPPVRASGLPIRVTHPKIPFDTERDPTTLWEVADVRKLAGTVAAIGVMALAFAAVGGVGSALGGDGDRGGRGGDDGRECRIGSPHCRASTTRTTTLTDTVTVGETVTTTRTVTQTSTATTTVRGGVQTVSGETVTQTTGTVTVDGTTTTVLGGVVTETQTETATEVLVSRTVVTPVLELVLTCSYTGGSFSAADPSNRGPLCPGTYGGI